MKHVTVYQYNYASLKRWVLRPDLKAFKVGADVTESGSLLYSLGANTENARAP